MLRKKTYKMGRSSVDFYHGGKLSQLWTITGKKNTILVTDKHVYQANRTFFDQANTIVLRPGEEYKVQATADALIRELIRMEADRGTTLVGVGGGVITDLTGYVASIYMRGIRFGFVPTTILAMVDASIGGKNGVDVGPYKNLAGIIRQPAFLFYDMQLLQSLPVKEWRNGFAEIIKHAAIRDAGLFRELQAHALDFYRENPKRMEALVERNAGIKIKVVQKDEFEKGDRRLLNFGHTLGHALETQYELSHGEAVALGMVFAATISEKLKKFTAAADLETVIAQYGLPTRATFNKQKVFQILKMDKKRAQSFMRFILLEKAGKACVELIPLKKLQSLLTAY